MTFLPSTATAPRRWRARSGGSRRTRASCWCRAWRRASRSSPTTPRASGRARARCSMSSAQRATVLRPSVVYGPGDRETLVFFQLAGKRLVPLLGSAEARAAMIHVADLVRLIVAMAREPGRGAEVRSAADDRPQGYTWEELLGCGGARGRQPDAAFRARAGGAAERRGAGRRPGESLRLEQHDQLAEAARAAPSRTGASRRRNAPPRRAGRRSSIWSAASPTRSPGIERRAGCRHSAARAGRAHCAASAARRARAASGRAPAPRAPDGAAGTRSARSGSRCAARSSRRRSRRRCRRSMPPSAGAAG